MNVDTTLVDIWGKSVTDSVTASMADSVRDSATDSATARSVKYFTKRTS